MGHRHSWSVCSSPTAGKQVPFSCPFHQEPGDFCIPRGQAQSSPLLGPWASLPLGFPIGRRGTLTTRPSPGLLP